MISRPILNTLITVFSDSGISTNTIFQNRHLIIIELGFDAAIWLCFNAFMLLLALVYFFYRVKSSRIIALEKKRFLLLRDLHDDMGSALSTINILSTMALKNPYVRTETTITYLEKISSYCQQMMDSMDDAVWSLDSDNDSMNKIIYRMREFASAFLEPKNIAFVFNTGHFDAKTGFSMIIRRDFYLIFKESVNYLAQQVKCTKIIADLSTTGKKIILTVNNNTQDTEKIEAETPNLILSIKKRADQIKGDIDIEILPGEGTRITLTLNKHKI